MRKNILKHIIIFRNRSFCRYPSFQKLDNSDALIKNICWLKSPSGILKKLRSRNVTPSLENMEQELNDIAGVRVVCSFLDDVYMLANALCKQDDIEVLTTKDYINNPKPSGYRSLHMIVTVPIFLEQEKRIMKVEVQLRTIAMDFRASLEHQLRYKKNVAFTEEMSRDIRYCAELSAELDQNMDNLREKVYSEQDDTSITDLIRNSLFT